MLGLYGKRLPFTLPEIVRDPVTGRGTGRPIQLQIKKKEIPDTITVSCWVPVTMTAADMDQQAATADWTSLYSRLRRAKVVKQADIQRPPSREVTELMWEKLAANPGPLKWSPTSSSGSALHDGFPTCDFSYEDSHVPTTGASRRGANLEVVSSCWCVYWDTGNVDGNDVEIYNYQCDFVVDGGSDVGITTTGHAPSDYNALLNALQSAFCGGSDCYSDDGTSADGVVSVSLSFSGADNPGDLVGFTASIDPIDSASSITWTWTSDDPSDDQTTTSGYCSDTLDTMVCGIPVYGDGVMSVDVGTYSNGDVHQEAHVELATQPCSPNDSRTQFRAEYDTTFLFTGQPFKPACDDFRQVATTYFTWPEMSVSLADPTVGGVFTGDMTFGIDEVRWTWDGPLHLTSTYRSPRYNRDSAKSHARNSQHMHGTAVDIRNPAWLEAPAVQDSVWFELYVAAFSVTGTTVLTGAQDSLCMRTCVHVDWR